MKILIIDDDYQIVQSLNRFMTRMGYICESVTNPEIALENFHKGKYDIIITDFKMPEMDGNEFLEQVKLIDPDCYVIIITGFASLDDAIISINLGAYAFLQKPFELNELLKTMKRIEEQIRAKTDFEIEKQDILQQISSYQKYKSITMNTASSVHDLNKIFYPIINKSLIYDKSNDIDEMKNIVSDLHNKKHKINLAIKQIFNLIKYLDTTSNNKKIGNIVSDALSITEFFLPEHIHIKKSINVFSDVCYHKPLDFINILVNLANNSINAMENQDSGVIHILIEDADKNETYIRNDKNSKMIKLTVSDNGKGINEQHMNYIFEPYYTTREIGKGFGYGLHEVKNIVEKNNGKIKVTNNNKRGTTFTLFLPCE